MAKRTYAREDVQRGLEIIKRRMNLEFRIRTLWIKACDYDSVPECTSFVVFSQDNPYIPKLDEALCERDQEKEKDNERK